MLRTPHLREREIEAFARDGFVIVRAAFSPEEVATIARWRGRGTPWRSMANTSGRPGSIVCPLRR